MRGLERAAAVLMAWRNVVISEDAFKQKTGMPNIFDNFDSPSGPE
jgi:hypothetical protein